MFICCLGRCIATWRSFVSLSMLTRIRTTRRYALGPHIQRLADMAREEARLALMCVAHEPLERLDRYLRERAHLADRTISLVELQGWQAVYVYQIRGGRAGSSVGEVNAHRPLYCTAAGKIFLSLTFQPQPLLDEYLAGCTLEPRTSSTITSVDQLTVELMHIGKRAHNLAFDRGEYAQAVQCLAAPLFTSDGHVLHAISVSWPTSCFEKSRIQLVAEALAQVTAGLSIRMGHWEPFVPLGA